MFVKRNQDEPWSGYLKRRALFNKSISSRLKWANKSMLVDAADKPITGNRKTKRKAAERVNDANARRNESLRSK